MEAPSSRMNQLMLPWEKAVESLPRDMARCTNICCAIPIALKEAPHRIRIPRNRSSRFGLDAENRNSPKNNRAMAANALSLFCVTIVMKPNAQYIPVQKRTRLFSEQKKRHSPIGNTVHT